MGPFPTAAALVLVFSLPLRAGVEVTATGDRVDVTAAQVPVSEVLDGLARNTRMKVVYEGPVPRTPVTVELRGRTPAQAVLGVLEGLGLNYALVLDVSGTKVETLMIVGTGALPAVPAPIVRPARAVPHAPQDEPTAEPEEPSEGEAILPVPGVPRDVPIGDANPEAVRGLPGPLNPMSTIPNASPFAPGWPPARMTPSPSPNPPSER